MEHRTTRPQAALSARRIRRSVAALAVLARLAGAPVLAQTGPAQVDQVIDGDTISVRLDGDRDTVRVTGVNTPETTHPTRGVEPDGLEAADDTTARRTGATVRLDLDPVGDQQDADGRILRYVMLPAGSTSTRPASARGTPAPFGPSRTPGNANVYSWKPRRAEGSGAASR